jgi:hypothetical protein
MLIGFVSATAKRWAGWSASRSTGRARSLVADDVGNAVWRVAPAAEATVGQKPQ